jgi:hypothetical protein
MVEKWTAVVVTLSTIAERYTQTAYAGFTFCFCMENKWQYVQRVVTNTLPFFSPLEEVIHKHFLPALLGVPSVEINGEYHQILTHSVKLGGVAIHNPVDTALSVHKASLAATRHLTVSFVDPATQFDLGAHCMCATEAGLAAQRDRLQNELIFLDHRRSQDKPAMARRDKQNCGAGTWLYVFPNQLNGNGLLANEWRNNVRLRYNHFPLDMPAACDGCGAKMTVEHALSCKTGGLVHIRHDDVADEWRRLCGTELSPCQVKRKPRFFSCAVEGHKMQLAPVPLIHQLLPQTLRIHLPPLRNGGIPVPWVLGMRPYDHI